MAAYRRRLRTLVGVTTVLLGTLAGCGASDNPGGKSPEGTKPAATEDIIVERGSNMD